MTSHQTEILMIDKGIKWCSYVTQIRLVVSNFESWKIYYNNLNRVEGFELWAYHFVKRIQCWQREFANPLLDVVMNERNNIFFKLDFRFMESPFKLHLSLLNHASEMLHQCYQTENLGDCTLRKIISWFRILSTNIDVLGEHDADSEELSAMISLVEIYSQQGDDIRAREQNNNLTNYQFFDPNELFAYITHVVRHHFKNVRNEVQKIKEWSVMSGEMMTNIEHHVGLDNYSDFLDEKELSQEDVEWLSTPDLVLLTIALSKKDINFCRSLKKATDKEGRKIHQCYAFSEEMIDLASSVRTNMTNREKSCHSLRQAKHGAEHFVAPNRTLPQCEDDKFVTGYYTLYRALPTKNGNHHTVYFGNGTTRKRKSCSNLPWHTPVITHTRVRRQSRQSDQSHDSMDARLESESL